VQESEYGRSRQEIRGRSPKAKLHLRSAFSDSSPTSFLENRFEIEGSSPVQSALRSSSISSFARSAATRDELNSKSPRRTPVDFDLPKISNETLSVRRHDLDSVILVSELGRRGQPTIGVYVEVRRLLRHHDLPLSRQFVETKRVFSDFGELLSRNNRLRSYSHFSKDPV
jgi:hypothetical protein